MEKFNPLLEEVKSLKESDELIYLKPKITSRKEMMLILSDVIDELQGYVSNRQEGVGVTSEEYVLEQLMKLANLIQGYPIDEENLKQLQERRNKLNRQISTLKKVSIKAE